MPFVFADRDVVSQNSAGRYIRGTEGSYRWGSLRQATVFENPWAPTLGDQIPGFWLDVHQAISSHARGALSSWSENYVAYGDGGDFELDSSHLYDTLLDYGVINQYPVDALNSSRSAQPDIRTVLDELAQSSTDPSRNPGYVDVILYPEVWNRLLAIVRDRLLPEEAPDTQTTGDQPNVLWRDTTNGDTERTFTVPESAIYHPQDQPVSADTSARPAARRNPRRGF